MASIDPHLVGQSCTQKIYINIYTCIIIYYLHIHYTDHVQVLMVNTLTYSYQGMLGKFLFCLHPFKMSFPLPTSAKRADNFST